MPLPAPRPLDALRQLPRAAILTAEGCQLSDALRGLVVRSGTRCEVVDHPLLAMAALTEIEREGDARERGALVVAERQIDDLDGLFAAIRARLQRMSIWVFEADIAIEVQRGQVAEPVEPAPRSPSARIVGSTAPTLRITRSTEPPPPPTSTAPGAGILVDSVAGVANGEPAEDPPGPSGNTVTPEELEMLLDLFEGDRAPRRDEGGAR